MTTNESPLSFPCDFPIKVMGRNEEGLEAAVASIVERHTASHERLSVTSRTSKGGNYISVTVVIRARSKEQLDTIYRDLTACEQVLMAL